MAHKLTLKTKTLLEATSKAIHWVAKKSVNVALQGFLVECSGGTLSISASDGVSTDITVYIDVDTDAEFRMCIPADNLHGKLTVLAKDCEDITLTIGKVFVTKCGSHVSRISPYNEDHFPALYRDSESGSGTAFDTLEFAEAVRLTRGAFDPKSPFPALHDIYFGNGDVATLDGFRVAVYSGLDLDKEPMLINGQTCSDIAGAIASVGIAEISVNRSNNKASIRWGGGIITTAIGPTKKFPDYRSIITRKHETLVSVPLAEIRTAITLAAGDATAIESNNLVVLEAHEQGLLLNARSSSGSHQSTIDYLGFSGPSKRVGVSVKYLRDALAKIPGNTVSIGINDEKSLITLFSSDQYTYGIMPMYIVEDSDGK